MRLLDVARNRANGFPARLLEERQKKLASFGSDPDWRKQVAEETAWAGFRSRRLVEAAALLLLVLVLALGVLVLRLLVVMGRVFSFKV